MELKIICSIVIIACSSLVGIIFSNTYIERTGLLGHLISTLQIIETEILYGATPIPVLLEKMGSRSKKEIGCIFLSASNLLKENKGQPFEEIWSIAVNKEIKNTSFSKNDIEILLSLGKNLGLSNSEDQIKHIRLIQEEVKRQHENSIIEEKKNVKLFKNLGFLLGLSIVIVLF